MLPPSTKQYSYGIRARENSSNLTKFTINSIDTYVYKFFNYKRMFYK